MRVDIGFKAFGKPFDEIADGDCFFYQEKLYMRCSTVAYEDAGVVAVRDRCVRRWYFNAVNLITGGFGSFADKTVVVPALAKVVHQ